MFAKILVITLILSVIFTCPVMALTVEEEYSKQFETSGANEILEVIPDNIIEGLSNLGLDIKNQQFEINIEALFKTILDYIYSSITSPLTTFGVILTILFVCYLFSTLTIGERQKEIISYISAVILCSGTVFPIAELFNKTSSAVSLCCGFNIVLIPIYSGILFASGSVKSLGTINLLFVFSQGIEVFISTIFSPLVSIYTSLSICGSLNTSINFSNITTAFKKIIDWVLGITVTLYMGILVITGTISSISDSVTQRMGKFVINSSIPIVGGVISDSLSTILGALKYLKSSIGLYAVCALALILLPVFIEILLWRLVLIVSSFIADMLNQDTAASLIKSISNGVGIILSVIISSLVVFLISMVVVVMGGSGI